VDQDRGAPRPVVEPLLVRRPGSPQFAFSFKPVVEITSWLLAAGFIQFIGTAANEISRHSCRRRPAWDAWIFL
jgi:hypothetical protein